MSWTCCPEGSWDRLHQNLAEVQKDSISWLSWLNQVSLLPRHRRKSGSTSRGSSLSAPQEGKGWQSWLVPAQCPQSQRRKRGFKWHRAKLKHQLPWATLMPEILAPTVSQPLTCLLVPKCATDPPVTQGLCASPAPPASYTHLDTGAWPGGLILVVTGNTGDSQRVTRVSEPLGWTQSFATE